VGLTIHYSLKTSLTVPEQVTKLVRSMREFALDLPLHKVSEVVELDGSDESDQDGQMHWLRIQSAAYVAGQSVDPLRGFAFSTMPGQGCESANFGFCTYPSSVKPEPGSGKKRAIATKLEGWRWSSFCKTQYASDPKYGGIENFLRCHLSIVKMLDFAKQTGLVEVKVSDEGHYWENRDLQRLAREVGQWNELIAGVVGLLRPVLQEHGKVTAPITAFQSFEHLEAKGIARLEALRKSLDE